MISKEFVLKGEAGLHMRPAQRLAEAAGKYLSDVTFYSRGKAVNGKSIIGIMSACTECGDAFCVECSGEDEKQAMAEIERCLKGDAI